MFLLYLFSIFFNKNLSIMPPAFDLHSMKELAKECIFKGS